MIPEELAPLAIPIGNVTPHPRNVRQGDVGAISESLRHHGQYRPIVVHKSTGHILAGNHTYKAAKSLGWKQIAATYIDCDDDQALRILLVDNRANDLANYDDSALADILKQLMDSEQQLNGTGFDPDDLQQLLEDLGAEQLPTIMGDPDEVPEQVPAKTVLGDVWLLGKHRLMCGSSTMLNDVERLMNGKKANMVFTDPPYGVSYQKDLTPEQAKKLRRRTDGLSIKNDDLRGDDLASFLNTAFSNLLLHCEDGGAWFVAAPQGGTEHIAFMQTLIDLGVYREPIIWVKDSMVLSRSDYHYRHEPLLYGWKPGAAHTGPPDRTQTTVWEIARPKRSAEHPTMKPVELVEKAIKNHTTTHMIVADGFGGSGTTLIAAHQTNRIAYLMELDPHYCDVICARYQKATGTKPIAEATGNQHDFLT